jgi:ATP-dependent Clp protease ATP-binding subunit ClpB
MSTPRKLLDPTRAGEGTRLMEETLQRLIVGQPEALEQIVNIFQMHVTGLCAPGRPVGSFLFLGPTGTGKTRTVEATAESITGKANAIIKIDCAEFQHSHEIAKLIGSPPGYLGHRETHPMLSQEVINQHHTDSVKLSFILFDEIEKASDALWNLLLGILDKATLTLGDNRKVDFSRSMIFLTSNLGAAEMGNLVAPRLGLAHFHTAIEPEASTSAKMAAAGIAAARRKFTPEFMNRLDKIVVFRTLTTVDLRRILDLELGKVQTRILQSPIDKMFVVTLTDSAKQVLLDEGTDAKYGARHLKRAIERLLTQPLSNLIATGQANYGDWVEVDCEAGGLTFAMNGQGLSYAELHDMASVNAPVGLAPASNVPVNIVNIASFQRA